MDTTANIKAMHRAAELRDELLVLYHERATIMKAARLENARRYLTETAAAMGYRIERIEPEADADPQLADPAAAISDIRKDLAEITGSAA